MFWRKCRGCEAKDEEIRHLLALLGQAQSASEKAAARFAEAVSPGAERRVVLAMTPPRRPGAPPTPGRTPVVDELEAPRSAGRKMVDQAFPGYEREEERARPEFYEDLGPAPMKEDKPA